MVLVDDEAGQGGRAAGGQPVKKSAKAAKEPKAGAEKPAAPAKKKRAPRKPRAKKAE
jgi:hypothetical protein